MFSQRIVGDERFLEMPLSTQTLYFHLGVYADDDGFVNPKKIIRMIGANPDDLKLLITKQFVIPFETGVVVITNWKENNYIQGDRYHPTIYQDEIKQLECIQDVYKLDTQVRLGKVRLGKVRLGKVRKGEDNHNLATDVAGKEISDIIYSFKDVNPSYERLFSNTTERKACARLISKYGVENLKTMISHLQEIISKPYAPKATTPYELEKNLGKIKAFVDQEKGKNNNIGTIQV